MIKTTPFPSRELLLGMEMKRNLKLENECFTFGSIWKLSFHQIYKIRSVFAGWSFESETEDKFLYKHGR